MGARVMGHKSWARELGALVGFMSKGFMSDWRMRDERARDTRGTREGHARDTRGTTKNVRWKVMSPDKSELPAESPPDEALLILLSGNLFFNDYLPWCRES